MPINSAADAAIGLLGAVAGTIPQVQEAQNAENKAVTTFTNHNPELAPLVPTIEAVIESYVSRLGQGVLSLFEELMPHLQTAATTSGAASQAS